MNEGAGRAGDPGAAGYRRRWPFWVLQATEIAVALVFVDISTHVHSGGLLVGAAVLFMILAAPPTDHWASPVSAAHGCT